MKTKHVLNALKGSIVLVCTLLHFACDQNHEQSDSGNKSEQNNLLSTDSKMLAAGLEDSIELSLDPMEPGVATGKRDTLLGLIRIKEGSSVKTLKVLADVIDQKTIDAWKKEAETLHGSDSRPYLPVLMIYYGLIPNKQQMTMMFQPVCLHRKRLNASVYSDTLEEQYKGATYARPITGGSFASISATSFTTAVSTYTNALKIKHDCTNTDSYTPGIDPTYAVYPFQEIYRIMSDNNSDTMMVWNVAGKIRQDGNVYVKHNVLLGPDILHLDTGLVSFQGKFGDLSHLCPPSCTSFSYRAK